jgi:hypothetical protein
VVIQGDVTGRVDLRRLQALLGTVPEKLRTELAKGTRTALAPLKREIPEAELARMPARYGAVLSAATKVAVRVTAGDRISATVTVSAKGLTSSRDVNRLNRGELRHPVFGRRRMTRHGLKDNPWSMQHVRPGMVDDPIELARRRVLENAEDARDRVADEIVRE